MWSVDLVGFNQLKFILIAQNESLCFRALKTQAETQPLMDTSFVLRAVLLPQTLQKAVVCFLGVLFGGHRHAVTFFQYFPVRTSPAPSTLLFHPECTRHKLLVLSGKPYFSSPSQPPLRCI